MDVDCEHCGSAFVTKYALKKHQETSVYCLKLQGKSPVVNHICEDCNKIFTTVSNLNKHRKICPIAFEKESDLIKMELTVLRESNKQKDSEIRRLKKKLKAKTICPVPNSAPYPAKYAAKFKSIKTDPSFFCNAANVTTELSKGLFSMGDGVPGLIAFILPFISKDGLKCYVRNDRTRDSFYRYNANGLWTKDACCRFIREILDEMKSFVEAWWIEYSKKMSLTTEEGRVASDMYCREYLHLHQGIMYPNSKERDALLREIAEKTSHITNI